MAIECFNNALKFNYSHENFDSGKHFANCYDHMGWNYELENRYGDAIYCYEKCLCYSPNDENEYKIRKITNLLEKINEYGEAIVYYNKLKNPPSDFKWLNNKMQCIENYAYSLYLENNLPESFKIYQLVSDLYQKHKNDSVKCNWYDEVLIDCINKYSDDFFENFFNIENNYDLWIEKTKLLFELNRYDDCIDFCEFLLDFNSKNFKLWLLKGKSFFSLEEYDSARICAENILIQNFDEGAIILKMRCLIKLKKFEDAFVLFKKYNYFSFDLWDLDFLALGLMDLHRYSDALECYINILEVDSYHWNILDYIKECIVNLNIKTLPNNLEEFYLKWIYKINYKFDKKSCPKCGGKLIPIAYGYLTEDGNKKVNEGKCYPGGCCVGDGYPTDYCFNCDEKFYLGVMGLNIDYPIDSIEYRYVKRVIYNISNEIYELSGKNGTNLDELSNVICEKYYIDNIEFSELINQLLKLNYIYKVDENHIKILETEEDESIEDFPKMDINLFFDEMKLISNQFNDKITKDMLFPRLIEKYGWNQIMCERCFRLLNSKGFFIIDGDYFSFVN